ncbi:MAG: hypothetical protein KIT27_08900 [Legionellales bacterium]|nr:hypothetical protein [Legionellales bacterium]
MDTPELQDLALHTDALLKTCRRLKQENQYLLDKQAALLRERNELKQKNNQALQHIMDLIARLQNSGENNDSN